MIIALLLAVLFISSFALAEEAPEEESGGAEFKHEYEILNGQSDWEGTNTYKELEIPEDLNIVYADLAEATGLLKEATGIFYFGFPECPWCRTLVPVLIEAIGNSGYEGEIYYCNALYERDYLSLDDDGNVVVEQEGSEAYTAFLEEYGSYVSQYEGFDESVRRLYFPTLMFVKDGEILEVHVDTIEGQENGYDELTDEQHAALLELLLNDIAFIAE